MKKSMKEGIVAIVFALIGMLTFMVLAIINDDPDVSTTYVSLAMVALMVPMLVYAIVQDCRKEKAIRERAKRIHALKEKNGYVQSSGRNKEMNKGIAFVSFFVLCLVAAFCCLEYGYTGAGIVFLGIGTVMGVGFRFWQEDGYGNKKRETAKNESKQ